MCVGNQIKFCIKQHISYWQIRPTLLLSMGKLCTGTDWVYEKNKQHPMLKFNLKAVREHQNVVYNNHSSGQCRATLSAIS